MIVRNVEHAIEIARAFLRSLGYSVYKTEIKSAYEEDGNWCIKAAFTYWFEDKTATVIIDSQTGEVKNYVLSP